MRKLWVMFVIMGLGTAALAKPVTILPPGRKIHIATRFYTFDYSYPPAAGRIPALKAWLDADATRQRQFYIKKYAPEKPKDISVNPGNISQLRVVYGWKVVTDLPRWLSLSASIIAFNRLGRAGDKYDDGDGLLWDKTHNRIVDVGALFTLGMQALSAELHETLCSELNRQRESRKREKSNEEKAVSAIPESALQCPDVAEWEVILGSSDYRHFNRIGVLTHLDESLYEVTLPVTPAILAAVKPAYRAAFAVPKPSAAR